MMRPSSKKCKENREPMIKKKIKLEEFLMEKV